MKLYISLSNFWEYEFLDVKPYSFKSGDKHYVVEPDEKYVIVPKNGTIWLITKQFKTEITKDVQNVLIDRSLRTREIQSKTPSPSQVNRDVEVKKLRRISQKLTETARTLVYEQEQSKAFTRHLLKQDRSKASVVLQVANGHLMDEIGSKFAEYQKMVLDQFVATVRATRKKIEQYTNAVKEALDWYQKFVQVIRGIESPTVARPMILI